MTLMKKLSTKRFAHTISAILISQMAPASALADASVNVLSYTKSQINYTAKQMANAISNSAPTTVDRFTTLLGAVYVPESMTFIYKYESSVKLDENKMRSYITHNTCADKIRKSYMIRGLTFKHIYITPAGQRETTVRQQDCQ